jgi:hypothetical protein
MEGCKSAGSKNAVCDCAFDKIENEYTRDQLLDMKIGIIPKDFGEFMVKATLGCVRES